MLILEMLLEITGFTQEELANFIGVSRASINTWLKDDAIMTKSTKQNIADKFIFPVTYFDVSLDSDISFHKLIYSTLYDSWKRISKEETEENNKKSKINDIMHAIKGDYKTTVYYDNLSDIEMLDGLANGYNPFTGEIFEDEYLLNHPKIRNLLMNIYSDYKEGKLSVKKESLDKKQKELFEELRKWRLSKTFEEGYRNAYMVFSDRELINIILANIKNKEDLINVKGIGNIKYDKYADELYEIIMTNKSSRTVYVNPYKEFADSTNIGEIDFNF